MAALTGIGLSGVALAVASSSSDQDFYRKAAIGGVAEVESGKLAQTKGTSKEVRDFGAMMVIDHTRAGETLKSLAAGKRITLPAELDDRNKAVLRELEMASGANFDVTYLRAQAMAHEETAMLLKQQIMSGKDGDAQAWASATLPTVTAHLKMVRALLRSVPTGGR